MLMNISNNICRSIWFCHLWRQMSHLLGHYSHFEQRQSSLDPWYLESSSCLNHGQTKTAKGSNRILLSHNNNNRIQRGAARDIIGTARDKTGTASDKTGTTQEKTGTARDKTGTGAFLDKRQIFLVSFTALIFLHCALHKWCTVVYTIQCSVQYSAVQCDVMHCSVLISEYSALYIVKHSTH